MTLSLLGSANGAGCLCVSLIDLPKRSAYVSPSGNLLEFLRPRFCDRGALVSSSFPSRLSAGKRLQSNRWGWWVKRIDTSLLRPCRETPKASLLRWRASRKCGAPTAEMI